MANTAQVLYNGLKMNYHFMIHTPLKHCNPTRSRIFGMDWYDPTCYAIKILDAKYEQVQIDDVVSHLEHLNDQQKADIKQVLSEFTKLCDGNLGVYPHRKFHIDLEP
jgi:hypothetical protein